MNKRPKKAGFVLIELVTVLILVGIIGVFSGFFLFTGVQGYLTSKQTSEGALQAQTALERISKELADLIELPVAPVANASVTYTSSELPGQRSISYNNNVISITVNGTPYPLLTDVKSFSLAWERSDLDNDGTDDISGFTITFTAGEIGQPFSTRIYPRRFFAAP